MTVAIQSAEAYGLINSVMDANFGFGPPCTAVAFNWVLLAENTLGG